jgi:hypothetical protein
MRKIGIRRGLVLASSGLLAAGVLLGTAAPGLAAPAATVQVTSHSLPADVSDAAVITGKAVPAKPDIKQLGCSDKTSFHVYMAKQTICYGFTGTVDFSGNDTTGACAGNNEGHMLYELSTSPTRKTWDFTPGSAIGFPSVVDVVSLTITGYTGSDSCP